MALIRILASGAVVVMRYSSTSRQKLQYQIACTEKSTGMTGPGIADSQDLSGRPVSSLSRPGVYIRTGKKIVVGNGK